MHYNRDGRDVIYRLSEDGQYLCVADIAYPRIWWPLELDLRLSSFDLSAVCDMCDQAIESMYSGDNPLNYRIDWDDQ